MKSSRKAGLYKLSPTERIETLFADSGLKHEKILVSGGLTPETADKFSENVIGLFSLPLSIAPNFIINGKERLVPMSTEEPSVVAAASAGALKARETGGFKVKIISDAIGAQILFENTAGLRLTTGTKEEIFNIIKKNSGFLSKYGGGASDISFYNVSETLSVVLFYVNTAEAMGANIVNTIAENSIPEIEKLTGLQAVTAIVTNSSLKSSIKCSASFPVKNISKSDKTDDEVARNFITLAEWAFEDPLRAVTHNKGIMNGIEAVAHASGNDTRAISAAIHYFASFFGKYSPLSSWTFNKDENTLDGTLITPLPVGFKGGMTGFHPTVKAMFELCEINSKNELIEAAAACGLANNFSALRALADEGIQSGHMKLHEKRKNL